MTLLSKNLSVFFNPHEFGCEAEFTAYGESDSFRIIGILEQPYAEAIAEYEGVSTDSCVFYTAETMQKAKGGTLKIDTQNYNIVEVKPDGTGIYLFVLERKKED